MEESTSAFFSCLGDFPELNSPKWESPELIQKSSRLPILWQFCARLGGEVQGSRVNKHRCKRHDCKCLPARQESGVVDVFLFSATSDQPRAPEGNADFWFASLEIPWNTELAFAMRLIFAEWNLGFEPNTVAKLDRDFLDANIWMWQRHRVEIVIMACCLRYHFPLPCVLVCFPFPVWVSFLHLLNRHGSINSDWNFSFPVDSHSAPVYSKCMPYNAYTYTPRSLEWHLGASSSELVWYPIPRLHTTSPFLPISVPWEKILFFEVN